MSKIKEYTEIFSSKLTDSVSYVDTTGKYLKTGDMLLIYKVDDMTQATHKINKEHLITNKFCLGIFVKLNNCSKIILGKSETGNLIVRTLHDNKYNKFTKNYTVPYILNAVAGNYSNIPDEWKKSFNYDDVVEASKKWLNFNKNR